MEPAEQISQFLTEYWPAIVAVVLAAAKLVNKLTKRWPKWGPKLRWLGWLVELIDIIRVPAIKKTPDEKKVDEFKRELRRIKAGT